MKKYLNVIICFVIISLNKNVFSQHSDLSGVIDTKVCQSGIREDNTNYIYCARQNLQKIPMLSINNNGAAVSNIVYDELVLSDNLIERIDFNSFGSNFKVRKLYLDNNPLRFIHKSSFEHVRNYLEELYLEQKQIKATTIADSDEMYDEGSELPNGYILDENDSNLFEAAVFQKCFNLHLLSLKSYRIPHLKANMFLKMTKLDTLILASNRLRQIDEAAFAGLEHSLANLNLDSNHLEWVPSKPLERMKKLKRLSLSQNRIKTLHANAFFYLNSLNTLDLSYNYLSRFDENAFSGTVQNSLRSLQLQNNELKWPHYIYILYNLHLLQDLNLDFNKLGQKANNIQIKPEEENLLRFNEDKKVNNSSSSVYLQLASISMQGNGLTDQIINSIFAEAHDYEWLRANEYFIVNPSTAKSFTNENNRKLFVYSSLTKFNLARNKLTTIPKDFFIKTNMTYLKTLILEKNPFINAHELRFTGLEKSLLNLNLNSVGFNLYSIDSLYSLENLQTLKLNANSKSKSVKPLTKSSNNSFFNNLISLELQNNNLKELPEYLCGLHALNDLDLSSNSLASFNSLDCLLFKSDLSVKLKQLNLNNNPLKCDCSMRKLKIWLMRNYEKDLLDLIRWQCAEPNDLNGRYFANLDLNELKCHLPAPTPTTTAPLSLASTTAKIETTTSTSAITKALKILTPDISRTSTITLKTVTSNDLNVSKMAFVESTKEQGKLFDLDNSTLILIAITFGLMLVVLLVLIMLYMSCFRSSNEKLKFLNKYEHRQFCSPSSMTSSSSNSTTSTTSTAARTKTSNFKNNDSFSRNSQLTLLSNELLLKLNKQQTSNQNECCSYYEKNLKEINFFQLNEEFRPFNNSSVSKGNLISSKQPVYTIDQNENHIYHEINTPVKYLSYQNPYDSPYESNFNYFMFPTAENSNSNPNNQYSGLIV